MPKDQKQTVKDAVGELILSEMDKLLDQGRSPVTGGKFKALKKDYAKELKSGDRNPDLLLSGDMRNELTFKSFRDGIEIGIFADAGDENIGKADNHNKNSAKSKNTKVPQRQFVPYDGKKGIRGSFTKDIRDKIDELIDGYKE